MIESTKDYDFAANEFERLQSRYDGDIKKMKFLKTLFGRCLAKYKEDSPSREKSHKLDEAASGNKACLGDLTPREKEALFSKLILLIDNQLEQTADRK